jgi:hypothetical protein
MWCGLRSVEVSESAAAEWEEAFGLDRVAAWRFDRLFVAGFDFLGALALAVNPAVELADAERLLAAGCDPDTAQRILI